MKTDAKKEGREMGYGLKKHDLGNNETLVVGIDKNSDGSFTVVGAQRLLAHRRTGGEVMGAKKTTYDLTKVQIVRISQLLDVALEVAGTQDGSDAKRTLGMLEELKDDLVASLMDATGAETETELGQDYDLHWLLCDEDGHLICPDCNGERGGSVYRGGIEMSYECETCEGSGCVNV